MTKLICLDNVYSTTRLLTSVKPVVEDKLECKYQSALYLPKGKWARTEGGLRTQGYFKKSHLDKPLITIVTVVFNGVSCIEDSIRSVLHQSYDNLEYIIIDGGSSDGTLDIVYKYQHAIDYWLSEKDDGIYDAMNKAIDLALGDWIYFLGADDILHNCTNRVSDYLDDSFLVMYGDVYMLKRHKLYTGKFSEYKLTYTNICHQSIFYNKKAFYNQRFNLTYKLYADYALNIMIFNKNFFSYMPILIATYNDFEGKSATGIDSVFVTDYPKLLKEYLGIKYFIYYKIIKLLLNILNVLRIKGSIK